MPKNNITHVGIIGTGVIGTSWATHFLNKGMEVTAIDPAPDAEKKLRAGVAANAPEASQDLLHFEKDLAKAVQDVQFVQENALERVGFKKQLFKKLDAATAPSVILASSSSSITASEFQMGTAHPERVVLGHPFNPPHLIPLVEVCGGRTTSEETVEMTMAFYRSIGKEPIRLHKEIKGHIANRLQAALWQEASYLVQQGVASTEDIDLAISHGPGLRWALLGPFLNLDLSGGEGGIRHTLEHLGTAINSILNDLGKVEMNPELIALLSNGVSEQLEGKDLSKILQQRNDLLAALLELKNKTTALP